MKPSINASDFPTSMARVKKMFISPRFCMTSGLGERLKKIVFKKIVIRVLFFLEYDAQVYISIIQKIIADVLL